MQWYIGVLKKYIQFAGRARRKEYWMFLLFNIIISLGLFAIERVLGLASSTMADGTASFSGGPLSTIYSLATLVPGIAVAVRRLHDTGRSGWFMLLALIPLVGGFILLYFMIKEGDTNTNQFGTNPKLDALTA
jgi:uncharacterized membrane protein YhaH (DUF805 family)